MGRHRIVCLGWMVLIAVALSAGGCKGFVRWLEGEPESVRVYRQAERLFDRHRFTESAVAYRAWLADYRDEQDVLRPFVIYKLAESYRLVRDYDRAVRAYVRLLEMYGSSTDPSVEKIITLPRARLDDIQPQLEVRPFEPPPAEPEPPADSVGDFSEAEQLFDDQHYAEAAVAYEAWLANYRDEQDVLRPLVIYKLGESHRLGGDDERAAEAYAGLIEAYSATLDADIRNVGDLAEIRLGDITTGREPSPETEEPGVDTEDAPEAEEPSVDTEDAPEADEPGALPENGE